MVQGAGSIAALPFIRGKRVVLARPRDKCLNANATRDILPAKLQRWQIRLKIPAELARWLAGGKQAGTHGCRGVAGNKLRINRAWIFSFLGGTRSADLFQLRETEPSDFSKKKKHIDSTLFFPPVPV